MGIPSLAEFDQFVIDVFGQRKAEKAEKKTGSQKPTAGLGFLRNQRGLYAAVQKGAISETQFAKIADLWRGKGWDLDVISLTLGDFADDEGESDALVDASHLAGSKIKKSERTGFHAEMTIVSAMIHANSWQHRIHNLDELNALIRGSGGAMIAANAQACKHCGNFMGRTAIEFPNGVGKASLTGWWNPILDRTFAHSSPEFGRDVPGF
jgi:hypothetical protein